MYGSALEAKYGAKPPNLWIKTVEELSNAEIKLALKTCLKETGDFPPSLSKFISYAKPPKSIGAHVGRNEFISFPKHKSKPEIANAEINKWRKLLKK